MKIIDYSPLHRDIFRDLNLEWIEKYFEIEEPDRRCLDNPDEYIIQPGGAILLAQSEGRVLGACALIKCGERRFELAKMAVSPSARGRGIGMQLGLAAIARARELGAEMIYLDSNTKLKAALALYRKLGFRRVDIGESPYTRVNIRMERHLGE